MKLDLSNLQNAISQLEKAIEFSESDLGKSNPDIFEQFRNSTVQCFEYTYELSWKFMKRQIEISHANPSIVDEWEYKDLIREASQLGLIEDPKAWFLFRRLRNVSSHAYNKERANEVYSHARELLRSAQFLLAHLRVRNK